MRGYVEASRFPLARVGGLPVPKLVLGHLPFVGESYQGVKKNQEYYERFSHVENTIKILKKAINDYGVTVVASTPATEGKLPALLLDAIKETIKATSVEIALIPCFRIPLRIGEKPIDDYRRWITYYEIERKPVGEELLEKYIADPILQCREGWKEKFPKALTQLGPYCEEEVQKLRIDHSRLNEELQSLDGFRVLFAEPGSETDFLAMTGRFDLLEDFTGNLRDKLKCQVILATHHAGSTIPILDESKTKFSGYLTPVNRLGVMMLPTQELAIKTIRGAKKPVMAIKPLAGGRIRPIEAFEYVYKEQRIDVCMVGVASEKEVDEDLKAVQNVLREE